MKGPAAIPPKFATLQQMLAAAAMTDVSFVFVDRDEKDRTVPLTEIRENALSIASDLVQVGVRRGDRVAIVLPTSPDFVECFFGVLCAGGVPVPLYPPVRLGRLDEYHRRTAAMLQATQAALVVTDERIRRFLGAAVEVSAPRLGCLTVSSLGGSYSFEADAAADDVALIQFSSGTTHDPKPVALTHRNLLSNLAAIDHYIADGGTRPVGVTWLPLYHDMGLIGNLLLAFYVPGSLVLLPPEVFVAEPAAWLRAISRHRGTHSSAPNFAFSLCLKRIRDEDLEGVDLSSWKLSLNGAESISAPVQRRFTERFRPWGLNPSALTPVYGMAEASLAVTFKRADTEFHTLSADAETLSRESVVQEPGDKELVSVGCPLAGVEVEVRDEEGRALRPGKVGRVFVRGPSVMAGYFARPDLTGRVLVDGWLDTGDLGFEHHDELFITGRHKDVVIVRGANHAPEEFEAALDGLAGVRTGCAVAVGFVPAGEEEEALAMLVETTSDAASTLADDVASRVAERTHIRPAHVELLQPGTLPRTTSGKLRRGEARTRWLDGTLQPPRKVTALRLLLAAANGELRHTRAARARRRAG